MHLSPELKSSLEHHMPLFIRNIKNVTSKPLCNSEAPKHMPSFPKAVFFMKVVHILYLCLKCLDMHYDISYVLMSFIWCHILCMYRIYNQACPTFYTAMWYCHLPIQYLRTMQSIHKKKLQKIYDNVVSMFIILCWATFLAIPRSMQLVNHRLATLVLFNSQDLEKYPSCKTFSSLIFNTEYYKLSIYYNLFSHSLNVPQIFAYIFWNSWMPLYMSPFSRK